MSATRPPASSINSRPRFVSSIELGATVGRIGSTGQIAEVDEVVDELRGGGQAQLRAVCQLGQPNAAHPDVAEDLEVRFADIAVSGVGPRCGQVIAELAQQPDQQLSDGLPVGAGDRLTSTTVVREYYGYRSFGFRSKWRVAMIAPSPDFVSTDLCRLHVRRTGTGSAGCVVAQPVRRLSVLGPADRRTGAATARCTPIDGPSHGKSEAVPRDFTFDELGAAAEQALDRLGLTEPVDWVGNAWGGHVGIRLATGSRLRTLTTIGTPIQGFTLGEKLTKAWPLVGIYRFTGPNGFIVEAALELARRHGFHCRATGSGRDGHGLASEMRTATGCSTRCDR